MGIPSAGVAEFSHLTLRRESFGGLAFSALDGTLLELDGEGYEGLLRLVQGAACSDRGFESVFARRAARELGGLAHRGMPRPIRIHDHIVDFPFPFSVLSAPTLADFQITTRCDEGCPHCYVSALPQGEDVSLSDARHALESFAEAGVCQVALGGGEPLLHPAVGDILRAARELGLVPNLTTSGRHLCEKNINLLKETCGAVALSLEAVGERFSLRRRRGFPAFISSLESLLAAGIPTVLQVTVGGSNLAEVEGIVEFALGRDLYGVIFLAYKPVGRGELFDKPLAELPMEHSRDVLSEAFRRLSPHTRVGYDCCLAPLVAGFPDPVFGEANAELEGCSALRGSVGVTHRLEVVPCTFFPELRLGNLRTSSLLDIWRGAGARDFRRRMQANCEDSGRCCSCRLLSQCAGGCPILSLVPCAIVPAKSGPA